MALRMPNQTEVVDKFMGKLEHPLKAEIEDVRAVILGADENISEHIKWNAPSFCYAGEDRVTFNLHSSKQIQLIFHRGAKGREDQDFTFEDSTGLLKWVAADRASLILLDKQDVEAKKPALQELVVQWMKSTAGG